MNFNPTKLHRNESDACKFCTNRCCSHIPGIMLPSQLKEITPESILNLFQNGYCVDWWEGDPREDSTELDLCYYLRPRMTNALDKVRHPTWGGADCIFLTESGCKHEFQDRPHECQNLVPNESAPGNCHANQDEQSMGKRGYSLAWLPYQSVILEALNLYDEKSE